MVFEPAKKLIKLFEIIPLCQIKGFEKNRQAQNWYISATPYLIALSKLEFAEINQL